jgi:putative transposase
VIDVAVVQMVLGALIDATRITLISLSAFVDWRCLLTIVTPETLIRWHRKGLRLFWRWKSSAPGRPPIPADVPQLIMTMAIANRTWGEERIAAELLVKLGIRVPARTVRRYMPSRPHRGGTGMQAWSTFIHNHSPVVLASDFFVAVTTMFRVLYVFVDCVLDDSAQQTLRPRVGSGARRTA